MKILSVKKTLHFCDPVRFGPVCWETKSPTTWKDEKGNQQIWIQYARSRAIICAFGIPLYTKKLRDIKTHWYSLWDLGPMYLPPSKTKDPGQFMLRAYHAKRSESPNSPLNN